MKEELKKYEVNNPYPFWDAVFIYGDGYDVMSRAEERRWEAIAGWGRDEYKLGNWPYVIVFHREHKGSFEMILYVEGDITFYSCPTQEIRQEITDSLAFFYWKQRKEEWVQGYESVEQLPEELRGPSRDEER